MKSPFSYFKKKNEKCFLALDIGTETIKVLTFSTSAGKKEEPTITILGASLQYFDKFGVFNSKDFEVDIIKKAISKAIEEAKNQASKEPKNVILGLPADILKGRIIIQSFNRKNPKSIIDKKEEKIIYQTVLKEAQKKISQIFIEETGILAQEIQFSTFEILKTKIDGYEVPDLPGFSGKTLDFRILATFLPKYYFENIAKITKDLNLKILKIIHEAQGLENFVQNEKLSAIFLDIGGEITQIFLTRDGKLELVNEFKMGGSAFSQVLSQSLGLETQRARVLKQEYSKGFLSQEVRKRINEIFSQEIQNWFDNLKSKILDQKLLPSNIFLFGGGSLLPEMILIIKWNRQDFPFIIPPQIKFIYPRNLKNIEDKTKSLNSPQDIPPLFLCHASEIGEGSGPSGERLTWQYRDG